MGCGSSVFGLSMTVRNEIASTRRTACWSLSPFPRSSSCLPAPASSTPEARPLLRPQGGREAGREACREAGALRGAEGGPGPEEGSRSRAQQVLARLSLC